MTIKMHDAQPKIETDRLVLRMFAPEDAETFHRIWNDPVVMKYIEGWRPTLEESRAAMTRLLQHWRDKGFGQWAVVLKEEGTIIGYAGFKHLDKTPEVELLYGIDKPYWNMGYTTEAARAALRFIFEHTALDRIVAVVDPKNTGSWRVMEKLGMKREKIARYYNQELVYYAIEKAGMKELIY
ncbi:MAG TPA: GNAT family N-acetyltransferase [Pyrinomonadaceae bacterium]|nr:GNAT family N-acetyltransferase [Pyrinomonadaceae bacterium]